jgi:hypothetical protein
MPASHYAGRVLVVTAIGVLLLVLGADGSFVGAGRWAAQCGERITSAIWHPLLHSGDTTAPEPVPWQAAC